MTTIAIHGQCAPRFEAVQRAFASLMNQPGQRGASVSLYWRGEQAVTLGAGTRDKEAKQPWQQDTLVNIFSTSKGVTALA